MAANGTRKPTAQRFAIVGAGLIGRAWAIVFARAGHAVTLTDSAAGAARSAAARVEVTIPTARG